MQHSLQLGLSLTNLNSAAEAVLLKAWWQEVCLVEHDNSVFRSEGL